MDYYSMKRKQLQALCKKHKIPANSANSVLADKLSQLLNEKQITLTQQRNCLKSPVETADECEPGVSRKQAKKVRFSPNNEVVEYELRNGKKQMAMATETRVRRKSVAKKVDESVFDSVNDTVDIVDDGVQALAKLTRSRVKLLEKDGAVLNNGKKQGRRAVKDVEKGTDSVKEPGGKLGRVTKLKAHTLGERGAIQVDENKQSQRSHKDSEIAGESVEEPLVARVKVTRSTTQDVNPQVQKKRGRPRVAKDVKNAEPPKEIMDIPVRVMRSSRQTIKEDIGSTAANLRVEKKRTRREMKATDLSDNLSNVAPEEKQEPPMRKLLRTKGIEVVDEVEDYKVEVINDSRVTRSKAHAMKPSGRNTRSEAENKVEIHRKSNRVKQLEEPVEPAGKKNVSRRKSVMQPGKIEEVLHFEEPVNRPATRRKSMMRKAPSKEIDKPLVGKRESVNEINIAASPIVGTRKTVGKQQPKRQSNNPSMINIYLDDAENVITQGKDASENEMETVANGTGSPKSRKRTGDPIIEDQIIETEYVSPVGSSSRRSTRSDSRSQGKAVTYSSQSSVSKKQLESILKTRANGTGSPKSRKRTGDPIIEDQGIETEYVSHVGSSSRHSTRSDSRSQGKAVTYLPQSSVPKKQLESILKTRASGGAIIRDGSSSKRAKLNRTKINDSEGHAEKSNTVGTPILKSVNFDLDEKVTETERTPDIGGSHRQFTHSAITNDRKVASQSAIKKQLVGDAQLSLHKVTKFIHDPAVNTAPGRVTRSGIKLGGNLTSSFSEKLSRTKLNESEDCAEKSNAVETPVLKSVYFELDEKVTETERTPDIGGSHRQFTHSAITNDRKVASQSAIKKQLVGDAQVSLHKVTKVIHDPAVNTAPGRVTRSGIKLGGNLTSSFSEKLSRTKLNESEDCAEKSNAVETPVLKSVYFELDEKVTETERTPDIGGSHRQFTHSAITNDRKVASQSAIKKQLVGDAQVSLHKVTKVIHNPAVNTAPGRVTRSGIKLGGNLTSSFSEKLSRTKLNESEDCAEKSNAVGTPVLKSVYFELDEKVTETERTPGIGGSHRRPTRSAVISDRKEPSQSAIKKQPVGDAQLCLHKVTKFTHDPAVNTAPGRVTRNAIKHGGNAAISFSEKLSRTKLSESEDHAEKYNTEGTPVLESVNFDLAEKVIEIERTPDIGGSHSRSTPAFISVGKEQSQSAIKDTGYALIKESEQDVSTLVGSLTEVNGYAQIEMESEQDVSTCKDSVLNYPDKQKASNNSEHDDEDKRASTQMQVMNEPVSEDNQLFDMDKRDCVEDVVDAGKELAKEPEFEGVPSTGHDVHEIPVLCKSDGVDGSENATKECGTDSMPLSGDNVPSDDKIKSKEVETPVGSLTEYISYALIEKESSQDVSTCKDSLLNYADKHEASNNSEDDAENERASTQMQVMNEPVSEDNQFFDMDKRDGAKDAVGAGKELAKEPEIERVPYTSNDVHEIPMLRKSDDVDGSESATEECGTDSMPLNGDNMPSDSEDLALNGESNLKPLIDDDSGTALFGKDDDFDITRLFEPTSGLTSSDDMVETPFSGNDIYGESDNAVDNPKPHLKPLTVNDDVQDEVNILPKGLETGSETLNADSGLKVPVAGNDVDRAVDDRSDGQDGESEHELLTSNATSTMDEQYVGGAGSVPALNENMPVVPEVLTRSSDLEPEPMSNISVGKVSCDTDGVCAPVGHSVSTMNIEATQTPAVTTITVDACEESIPDINKDAQIFGDIYGLENAQRVMDTEDDSLNELKVIGISEPFEGALPKGSGIASPDMGIKQLTEETKMKTENDHASTDKKERMVSTIDHDLDSGKFVEDFPNHGVDQLEHEIPTREEPDIDGTVSGQLMGDFGDHGRLFAKESLSITFGKEESPVGDTLSDSPTFIKDDDRNKQEETRKASTSTDWGNYGFRMNEFHNPVTANENDDLRDDRISVLQTSARASYSIEGNYSPAADFVNSEKSEQGSRNVVDTEFDHDAGMLKENANANMTEELFNWPILSLKALFTKPATTPSSHLKEGQQDAVSFDFPDGSHDEDIGSKGTPTLDSNHHGESESARDFNALSLETLFTTPATTRITHVKDNQMENESSKVFNGKTQVTETQGQENVMNRVPNYENFYNKYFGDEVDGSSDRSEEVKGDQYDLSNEAARTGHLEASGLKVNSIRGGMPEKKED